MFNQFLFCHIKCNSRHRNIKPGFNNINPVINNALVDTRIFYEKSKTSTLNPPQTLEQIYYRYLYNKDYKNCDHLIEYFWMPKYVNANDASARTLNFYNEKNTNKV